MSRIIWSMALLFGITAMADVNPLLPDWHQHLRQHQQRQQRQQRRQRHQLQKWDAANCTNFSGAWKGTCTDKNGQRSDSNLNLAQSGCETLKISDFSIPLNGYLSLNSTTAAQQNNPSAVTTMSLALDWNQARTELTGTAQMMVKSLPAMPTDKSTEVSTYNESLKIDGGKLIAVVKTLDNSVSTTCEFTK